MNWSRFGPCSSRSRSRRTTSTPWPTCVRSRRFSIAAGERLYHRCQFRDLFEKRAADFVQPDISHAGGLGEVQENRRHGRSLPDPLCAAQSQRPDRQRRDPAVGRLHARTSTCWKPWPPTSPGERISPPRDLVFEDGYFEIPDRPGLGIELNEEAFADHPYQPRPLRHYRGDLTDIRPPEAVPYF